MHHFIHALASRAARLIGLLPFAGLALACPAQAQTFHAQAMDPVNPPAGESFTSDWPQYAEWVGTNWKTYQTAWASAAPGLAAAYSISEYYVVTGSYASSNAYSTFEFDDVVFTSTGTASSELVTLNLTIEGDYVVNNAGAGVYLEVQLQTPWVGTASAKSDGITTTGALAGYDMNTPLSFQVPLNVQVNTPFSIKVGLSVRSTTVYVGNNASGEYRLRLGGASTGDSGASHDVFILPDVITSVNSAQAGIVNNVWQEPQDLYLMASESTLTAGDELELTSWNGPATQPIGLFLTSVDGLPLPLFLGGSVAGVDGIWGFGPIAHDPSLVGHAFGFTSFALDPLGAILVSEEVTTTVL